MCLIWPILEARAEFLKKIVFQDLKPRKIASEIIWPLPQIRRTIWRRRGCCWWTQCRTHWTRPRASRETFSALHSKMGQRLPSTEARLGYWRSLWEIWIHFQHKSKTFAFSFVSMSVYWGASSKQAAKRIT